MEAKPKNKRLLIPILVSLPNIGIGMIWYMNNTLMPTLVGTMTDSTEKLALLISMGSFTGIFTPYISGLISDRSNFKMGKRRPWLLIGAVAATIFVVCLPFSPSYGVMFVLAFLLYFSVNFFQGPYYSIMPESVDTDQIGITNGWGKLFNSLGGFIVFFIGMSLWEISHFTPFLVVSVMFLIPTLIVFFTVKEDNSKFQKPPKLSIDFLKNRSAMKLFIAIFFFFFGYGAMSPFLLRYYTTMLHFTDIEVSQALSAFSLLGMILSIGVGWLCDRFKKRIIFTVGCILYAGAFVFAMTVSSLPGLWVYTTLDGISFILVYVTFFAMIPEIAPRERLGEYMGIGNLFVSISQFIATNVMGVVLSGGHYGLMFPICAVSMVIAAIIMGFGKMNIVRDKDKLKLDKTA